MGLGRFELAVRNPHRLKICPSKRTPGGVIQCTVGHGTKIVILAEVDLARDLGFYLLGFSMCLSLANAWRCRYSIQTLHCHNTGTRTLCMCGFLLQALAHKVGTLPEGSASVIVNLCQTIFFCVQ